MNTAEKIEALAVELEGLRLVQVAANCRKVIPFIGHETGAHRMWFIASALNERFHFAPVTDSRLGPVLAKATAIAESL